MIATPLPGREERSEIAIILPVGGELYEMSSMVDPHLRHGCMFEWSTYFWREPLIAIQPNRRSSIPLGPPARQSEDIRQAQREAALLYQLGVNTSNEVGRDSRISCSST